MAIYWRNIYDINIPLVNNERKLFFVMLNKIESSSFSEQRELTHLFLKDLSDRALAVFKQEEKALRKQGCPRELIDRQEIEHLEFIQKMQELFVKTEFRSAVQFIDVLKTFVINHIVGTDLECKKFLKDSYMHRFYSTDGEESMLFNFFGDRTLIRWSSFYETGIPKIDEQHIVFVNILNDLASNYTIYTKETIVDIIDEITQHINVHFITEEKYMDDVKNVYLDYKKHIEEHRLFTKFINDKTKALHDSIKYFDIEQSEKILKDLIAWLSTHLAGTDKEFAKVYISEMKSRE